MNAVSKSVALTCVTGVLCWAARCTTLMEPGLLREYEDYVARAENATLQRFDSGELSWVPGSAARDSSAKLASGKLVRWNISDAALNQRIAGRNGTVIHWIGAIRIHGASLGDLRSVLEDYDHYDRFYRPIIFECKAKVNSDRPNAVYDVILGLQSVYRVASLFPQHYAFRVRAHIDHSYGMSHSGAFALQAHMRASEIRESDSGVPGNADFLEVYHDHGIMWALNAYWRARQRGGDLYLEFETITLARSAQEFACKIGFVPIPKSIVSAAMDSMPADSVTVILEGTRTECERRALRVPLVVPGQ
jgi:hypothetical protein